MNCPKCGFHFEGTRYYCSNCGAVFDPDAPETMRADIPKPSAEDQKKAAVLSAIKSVGASPLFLIGIIAFTLMVVFDFISNFQASGSAVAETYSPIGGSSQTFDVAYVIGLLIGSIPKVLVVVGLWFSYITARQQQVNSLQTTGLSMIRGVLLFEMVISTISMVSVIAFLFSDTIDVIVSVSMGVDLETGWVHIPLLVRFVVAILFGSIEALVILYYVKLRSTLSGIRDSINRAEALPHEVSSFVVVMFYIVGVVIALSFLGSLAGLTTAMAELSVAEALSSLCTTVAYILFAVCLQTYKKRLMPHRTQFWSYTNK